MKKICSIILIFILIIQLQSVSFAISSISDLSVDYNPANASVTVSGEISSAKKGMLLTLQILSNDVPVGVAQTISNDDGGFEFETVLLNTDLLTGTLYVSVSSSEIAEYRDSFEYNSITDLFSIMKQISDASIVDNYQEIMTILSTYGAKLGVDYSFYTALDDDSRDVFEQIFYKNKYNLNAYDTYVDDKAAQNAFKNNLSNMCDNYDTAIMLAEFFAVNTKSEYDLWSENYSYAFDSTKTTEQYKYYKKAVGYSQLAEHIYDHGKVCLTIDEAVAKIYECSLLSLIEVKQHSVVKEIFTKFTDFFEIDNVEFNKLTSAQKSKIYPKLSGISFKTAKEAADKFNEYIYASTGDAPITRPTGGGGGGGGSFSSKGSWGTGTSSQTIAVDMPNEEKILFNDLKDNHWSYKAVKFLYDKKIVNGSGDGKFNPDNSVTRAEFIKMLVSSMDDVKLVNPDNVVFNDIDNSMWYAIYINAAKTIGITNGDSNGNFNPDGRITRQDMAVMLARAFNIKATGKSAFNDIKDASDYAVESIEAMYISGLIKGSGDGKFNPLSTATRAEASQMLYNILTSLSK